MRHAFMLLALTAAACGRSDKTAGGESQEDVQTAELTGLYEAEDGQGSRMCAIEGQSGTAEFALVTESPGGSCSGAGDALRSGNVLRLTMAGAEECAIDARIESRQLSFPSTVAPGCNYYCAPGATLGGQAFVKTGGTVEDAKRATDLAGGPLCG